MKMDPVVRSAEMHPQESRSHEAQDADGQEDGPERNRNKLSRRRLPVDRDVAHGSFLPFVDLSFTSRATRFAEGKSVAHGRAQPRLTKPL